MPESRRFPLPWTIEEQHAESFIVRDANGQALGYFDRRFSLQSSGPFFSRRQAGVYSVFMEGRGIYRERNGWGTQHSVRVKYDEHQELDISEDRYRARGYQPPFDQLPWKDESANDNT